MEITDHNENNMPNDITSLGLQNDIYSASNNEDTTSIPDVENQEDKREQVLSKIKKAGRDFLTVAALGSILITAYGCSPKEVNSITNIEDKPTATLKSNLPVEENRPTATHTLEPTITNTPTLTPEPTPTEEPTPTPQPEIDPKEFDYSMLDLMQWEGELEVSDIEKLNPGYIVQVREGYKTVMYELPLFAFTKEDENSYWAGLRILDIPEGTKLELLEVKKIHGKNGQNITVGTIRNHSSDNTFTGIGMVVLSAETEDKEIINFTETATHVDDISVTSFFLENGRQDQLPLSLLLKNLLEYQKENGPFKAGETYSIVEIAKITSTDEFRRLLYTPEGNNVSLDTVISSLAHTLINKNHIAFRTPKTINNENANFTMGYDAIFSEKYTNGVKINGGSAPENDMILTFQEGKNGEAEYYITGDMTGMRRGDVQPIGFISFYLSTKLEEGELESNLKRMTEVYEKHLDWERGGEEPLTENATEYKYYNFFSELGPEKLRQVLKDIYIPMKKSDAFK